MPSLDNQADTLMRDNPVTTLMLRGLRARPERPGDSFAEKVRDPAPHHHPPGRSISTT
jgi:hypothetical protein